MGHVGFEEAPRDDICPIGLVSPTNELRQAGVFQPKHQHLSPQSSSQSRTNLTYTKKPCLIRYISPINAAAFQFGTVPPLRRAAARKLE